MKWFLDLSARSKLFAGFGLMLVFLVSVIVTAYLGITEIQASQKRLFEQEFANTVDMLEVRADVNFIRIMLFSMLLESKRLDQDRWYQAIVQRSEEIAATTQQLLERNRNDPALLARVNKLKTLRKVIAQVRHDQIIPLIYANKTDEAKALILGIQEQRHNELRAVGQEMVDASTEKARAMVAESERRSEQTMRLFVVIGIVAILLGLIIVQLFTRIIVQPLRAISAVAERIASGDLTANVPENSRADEIGILGRTFHRMVEHLRRLTTERKQQQDEVLRLNTGLEARVQQRTKELEEKNQLLADQKVEVEDKNREIEVSKLMLEERAEQLAITSKYKSEFLSNISHELRTPLNSLLILSQLLAENPEHNMSGKQVEYAKIIHGSGKDLLELINDILDLSKIESGTVTLDLDDVSFATVRAQAERSFRHVAESRSLGFGITLAPGLPPSLYTDSPRVLQVMRNLLSNAFKFTQKGQVSVRIAPVESGWSVDHAVLNRAQTVLGFFVTDTGIGLAADKQKIIFEAFQQADTGTARQYGGTGLGLSISRELAWLLGGELRLAESELGRGSTFVLYLPLRAPESGQGGTSFTPKTTSAG